MINRVAVVTGAGTGIGKSVASLFLRSGWKTVFVGRRLELLKHAIEDCVEGNASGLAIGCDIADEAQVSGLFSQAIEKFGRIDILFNNAGVNVPLDTIDEIPVSAWRQVVDVNLTGAFLCARAAFAAMRQQNPIGGRIINNGSIAAYAPRPGSAPYTATKHAILGLTKTIALDGRPFSIACSQIDIGNAATELASAFAKGTRQADGSIKAEPMIDVRHVADAVLHMASLPLDVNILSMNVMATKMPFVGRG